MSLITFTGRVSGATKVKETLENYSAAIAGVFAKNRIENLLLKRTKERFGPPGSSSNAQTSPEGRPWAPLSENTSRHTNQNRSQKLVDSGTLRDSIDVVRKNMRDSALQSPTGGGFSIGITPNSPANAYARVHQFGGYSGRNYLVHIPARRFLGISSKDVVAVDTSIARFLRSKGIGVG
jgi:hypothetical protein